MKVSPRILLISIWGFFCALILAAPLLMTQAFPAAASAVYFPFSFFCHQNPDRSFMFGAYPLAVCHRCFGIYLGFLLGTLFRFRWVHGSVMLRRASVLVAVLPMLLDFSLDFSGLWTGGPGIRFATGLIFGCLISPLPVQGLAELLPDGSWRGFAVNTLPNKGDLS